MADEFQLLNVRGLTLRDDFNYFSYNSTRENFFPWTNLNDLIFLKQIKQIFHFKRGNNCFFIPYLPTRTIMKIKMNTYNRVKHFHSHNTCHDKTIRSNSLTII